VDTGLNELIAADQFGLAEHDKAPVMLAGLLALTELHRGRCVPYARMLAAGRERGPATQLADVPSIPVRLFKSLQLRSIPEDAVFRVMTSSGTTGQAPSRIYLDVETARLQSRALASIVTHYLGTDRRAMLIVDHPGVIADRRSFSARAAGTLGMMPFGRDHLFALDEDMRLDRAALQAWLGRHRGEELLVFGFTFMVWQDLLPALEGSDADLARATLVHSGGWKKLAERSVSRADFKRALRERLGIRRVHDFYGMVEQVGSVFFECRAGFFHAPDFGDVLVRDPVTWAPAPAGATGVLEVFSMLPRSYPGHALLTEDLGVCHGVDDCPCGRMGRRFEVIGRVPKAEIRGCSDTQERAA
jgi:hypothetical protein